ncbi:hypothetical protein FXF51_01605 [Nonomuraea sp. PA05]|uniref:hypothetical protein n=1 Tax=Nonomuraea sp. PA05 TaxID=2604466 RepID=UPI0011D68A55|nr:hypothetical protein [Nonomuraea sp. PA05]TYB71157.1 hypothetical protein FXF51_01605 [Nonomuraea sp. PA05]
MDDDGELAAEVVARLVRLLASEESDLRAGSVNRASHRGGGGRFFLDAMPDDWVPARPVRVRAERVDQAPSRRPSRARRALPPE